MTLKKKATKLGKRLKKDLGLDHVVAMRLAKLLVRNRMIAAQAMFSHLFVHTTCGDKCCSFTHLVGPKGKLDCARSQF